ncbi:MAG: PAS domain-containing protein [Gammaproteobacteria bacterium]|nr:PAS domain-containing protein [Gammaproteobacteria bacterium]
MKSTLACAKTLEYSVELFDLLSTGALLLDDSLRLVRVNPAAEVLLELSSRQALGEQLTVLLPRSTECHAIIERARRSSMALSEREMTVILPSARNLKVGCTVTPLIELGEPGGFLMELVPIEHHLRISREERLLSQNEVARSVVRGLAHEIRNPLGGLRGAAQLLEAELPAAELREYTTIIIDEADRLQRLLDRLLGPNSRPSVGAVNIHEVTERVVTLTQAEAPPEVVVTKDYDPSIPWLRADPERLIQALLNVMRNAVHAVGDGGRVLLRTRIARHCSVGSRHYRLAIRIDVVDNGPGVPPELADTLFYPLVTGRPEGTGLGLSIAQSLVNQHGGIIEMHREAHETVFSILLPLEL